MLGVFRRAVAALFFATILLVNAVSHAEVKTYVGEGYFIWVIYKDNYLETARERAKDFAMRNACEKAIEDVKSHMHLENLETDADLIETMTKNIVKLVEEPHFSQPEYKIDNDWDFLIRVTVKVQIDDSDIMRWLSRANKRIAILVAQTKAMRKENEKQDQQIAELREELAHNPQNKQKLSQKFEAFGKKFLSNQKVEKAWQSYIQTQRIRHQIPSMMLTPQWCSLLFLLIGIFHLIYKNQRKMDYQTATFPFARHCCRNQSRRRSFSCLLLHCLAFVVQLGSRYEPPDVTRGDFQKMHQFLADHKIVRHVSLANLRSK